MSISGPQDEEHHLHDGEVEVDQDHLQIEDPDRPQIGGHLHQEGIADLNLSLQDDHCNWLLVFINSMWHNNRKSIISSDLVRIVKISACAS